MKSPLLRSLALVAFLVASLLASQAGAETVKVGVLLPYTGPFQAIAQQMDDGIKMYMEQHAGELGHGVLVDDPRGGQLRRLVHPHVKRRVLGIGESPARVVELRRGHPEVEKHPLDAAVPGVGDYLGDAVVERVGERHLARILGG